MVGLVVLEGVLIGLLGLLVIGLLRSHADILRRLERLDPTLAGGAAGAGVVSDVGLRPAPGVAPPRDGGPVGQVATDITGVRPNGAATVVGVVGASHPTLLAFLTSGCTTCAGFWEAFRSGAAATLRDGTTLVAVTRGPEAEQPAAVARLAAASVTTVMSSQAWAAYGIEVSPYFVLVDGPSGRVVGEGAAASWDQMVGLLGRVWDDAGWVVSRGGERVRSGGRRRDREALVDADLLAAGISPGHPSLYPDPVRRDIAEDR